LWETLNGMGLGTYSYVTQVNYDWVLNYITFNGDETHDYWVY